MVESSHRRNKLLNQIAVFITEVFWYGAIVILLVVIYLSVLSIVSRDWRLWPVAAVMIYNPLLLATVAFLLRGIVRSARDGRPFVFANVRRLRLIGLCVFLCLPLPVFDFNLLFIGVLAFLGLLILVMAQVFDIGVRLQTDSDLTV